jgi:hypothetical protein
MPSSSKGVTNILANRSESGNYTVAPSTSQWDFPQCTKDALDITAADVL